MKESLLLFIVLVAVAGVIGAVFVFSHDDSTVPEVSPASNVGNVTNGIVTPNMIKAPSSKIINY